MTSLDGDEERGEPEYMTPSDKGARASHPPIRTQVEVEIGEILSVISVFGRFLKQDTKRVQLPADNHAIS
jgi:hypothetical protein